MAVLPNELPVFWACGVTPQVAIERARPELCITHAPGAMLITDLLCATIDAATATAGRREESAHVISR